MNTDVWKILKSYTNLQVNVMINNNINLLWSQKCYTQLMDARKTVQLLWAHMQLQRNQGQGSFW